MKYTILISMSLLSLLFGCRSKKTPEAARAWPRFPETDQPDLRIEPIALDSEYTMWSFYIPDNKKEVYVLAFRPRVSNPRTPYEQRESDCRIFCLDTQGKIQKRLDFKNTDLMSGASFGVLEGELLVMLYQNFLVLSPENLPSGKKSPSTTTNFSRPN